MQKNKHTLIKLFFFAAAMFAAGYWLIGLLPAEYRPFADSLKAIEVLAKKRPTGNLKRLEFYDTLKKVKNQKKSMLKNKKTRLKPLAREELIKTVCELEKWVVIPAAKKPFSDVQKTNKLAPCIAYAKQRGLLPFKATKKFLAKRPVKRSEAAAFLKNVYGGKNIARGAAVKKSDAEDIKVQETKTNDTPEDIEEPVTPFIPAEPQFIIENFFETVQLSRPLPNTFYKNEVYFFEGTYEAGNYKQAFVFLMQDDKIIENFVNDTDGKKFKIPVIFMRPGNYQLGVILGTSGRSKVANISVLEKPELSDSLMSVNPKAPEKLAYQYSKGILKLSWQLPDSAGNLIRLRFKQDEKQAEYFFRYPIHEITPFTDNLAKFSPGPGTWQVETAYGNTQLSKVQISSGWTASKPQQVTFAKKEFRTIDEKVTIEQFPEVFVNATNLIFKGKIAKNLAAKGVYTDPDGHVMSFNIQEGNLVQPIPSNTPINVILPVQQTGVYIFELNDTEGGAVVNAPVYVGKDLLPIIPDFFNIQNVTLQPTVSVELEKARMTFLTLINRARGDYGLNELILDDMLSKVAQRHSDDMVSRKFFGHNNPDGKTPEDRRRAAKYSMPVRENLAKAPTEEYAHEGLMRSPIHRQTILGKDLTRVGIGISKDSDGYLLIAEEFSSDPFTAETMEQWKTEFMNDIQTVREHAGLSQLQINATLEKIATDWSIFMVEEKFFSFKNSNGEKLLDRARNAGIRAALQAFILQGAEKEKLLEELVKHPPVNDGTFVGIGFGMAADPENGILSMTILYNR